MSNDRVILALDVPDMAMAIALVDRLPEVSFWKVGLELFISAGPAILEALKQRHKKIFLDLKLHDIPNTMAGAARVAGRYGVDLLTVHGAAGFPALQAAQQGAIAGATEAGVAPPKVIAVTLLTSINPGQLAHEVQVSMPVANYTRHLAQLSQAAGLAGVVCSPQEAASLRLACRESFVLVCPGVRPTWAAAGDQQRTLTPREAIAAGATYLVVGRPVLAADDPAAAWARLQGELAES
ncbi:MAG: orotidine-5'-phosphate decarboxylase [Oscillatoriales cyanobacterium]|nr:MAG: orotidine-5'-phosphate decarboxylase [Oscillatoriales cyanobacterium]